MSDLDHQLREWVTEACRHPPGSPLRQRHLTKVIRVVSNKLWRESVPYYQDALQQTWVYFCKNICGGYNPNLGSVATWLNAYLKRRLQDFYIDTQKRRKNEISSWQDKDGEVVDITEGLADERGDVEPVWEKVKAWAQEDADGELRKLHIEGYPEVTCQVLILRRLLSETSWKALSEEFGAPIPTLSSFYRRQCMPRLRKFGESEGYVSS
ncbi:MAG: sigma-70 family RNA polymerase sigma factor [Oscillatoriales cyanobacterium C42_A2020_001]|nr:sigma-70 family RNA polymerase sigma factor [Leptolyngbyaceae cyanobacterium C42_A2020_001]